MGFLLCASAAQGDAPHVPLTVIVDLALPRAHWSTPGGVQDALRHVGPAYGSSFVGRATDIRWDDTAHVLIAGVRDGTLRLSVDEADRSPLERALGPLPNAGPSGNHVFVGVSPGYLVTAAPFHVLSWIPRAPSSGLRPISTEMGFDSILDLDVTGDRLLVIGLRRAEKGELATDGAIAWMATLGKELSGLHAVQFSASGPGARNMDACADLRLSSVRFMPGGSFVVLPGAEAGIFIHDAAGKLTRTWPAELVGFDAGCPISEQEMYRFGVDIAARYRWLNQRRIVDDVFPAPGGIGFLVRTRAHDVTSWGLKVLAPDGKLTIYEVPISSPSEYARLSGDSLGRRLALLLSLDTMNTPPAGSNRVIVAELPDRQPHP